MNSNMSPIDWAKRPLQKYADFSGRAPRPEFWWWALAVIIASVVATIIDSLLGIKIFANYGPIGLLVGLGLLVPNFAVAARRLHDTNRSGWWLLLLVPYMIGLVLGGAAMMGNRDPYAASSAGLGIASLLLILGMIGAVVLLIFYCLAGTPGENRFGPDPKGSAE